MSYKLWGWVMVALAVFNASTAAVLFNKGDGWWVFGAFVAGACLYIGVSDLRKGYSND